MQTRSIGQCPRCQRVTFQTQGNCESGRCLPGESQLAEVPNCQWQERTKQEETLVCERCGGTADPLPLNVWPLRACK